MRAWNRPLDLLEAAYRLDGSDAEWMDNLVRATYDVFAAEGGAGGFVVLGEVDNCGLTLFSESRNACMRGRGMRYPAEPYLAAHKRLSAELQQRLFFGGSPADTLSHRTGLGPRMCADRFWIKHSGWDAAIVKDALELLCHDSALSAVVLAVPLSDTETLTAAERRLGERVSAHIGSAFRLRRQRRVSADTANAVLSLNGRIEHLSQSSDEASVKDAFGRRGHARNHNTNTDDALSVWQGLHDGRWSLVDYFDSDGKAFVLAVENSPSPDMVGVLTERQRAVLSLAALGYGNKQIAYALGVSQPAVAMSLRRARQTTGLGTRAQLVRSFKFSLTKPVS